MRVEAHGWWTGENPTRWTGHIAAISPKPSKALHIAVRKKEVTVHVLRPMFRDVATEDTVCPNEVGEMALAHAIGNKLEAAYRRGDQFEKRRKMMGEKNKFHKICE